MSFPTLVRQVDFPAPTGTFDAERAVAAVMEFCTTYDVDRHTRFSVVPDSARMVSAAFTAVSRDGRP